MKNLTALELFSLEGFMMDPPDGEIDFALSGFNASLLKRSS